MKLPIDLVPNTSPPRFRWLQVVDSLVGRRVVEHEGVLPPSVECAVLALIELATEQARQIAQLRADAEAAKVLDRTVPSANPEQPTPQKRNRR